MAERTVYGIFGTKAILGAICEEWLTEAGVIQTIAKASRHVTCAGALPSSPTPAGASGNQSAG